MTAANPNIDTLLRHQDWVRALARSLVADPSRAEDVAQQTMLEAITKAPRDLQRPKGWLAQVARNAARAFARSDRRRQAREHDVAKSDAVLADPADAAHRAQAHKSLVDSVFELPEPYHTVVLLRYFEDLEPQQIAKQLDRSVSTVRTQLQRGLTMMRDKLDRQFGDREAWHAAVLPLFLPKQVAAGVPILTAIGSLAMWKLLMPVVALIAALLIGLEAMWAEAPPVPSAGDAGAPEVAVVSAGEDGPSTPLGRQQVPTNQGVPAQPEKVAHRFHARVVSLDGAPMSGMTIAYRAFHTPRLVGRTLVVGNGSMSLDQPALKDSLGTRAEIERFALEFGEHRDAVVALLSGEEVVLPSVVTDVQGNFSFEDPKVEDFLEVQRDGYMIYGQGKSRVDGALIYIVGPSVDVAGHVVDQHGKPLEGVGVRLAFSMAGLPGFGQELDDGSHQSWNARSDEQGAFDLGEMPRHAALQVHASKAGYYEVSHRTDGIRGPVRWELRVAPKPKRKLMKGIVRLHGGLPAVNASVLFGSIRALTDELGQFSMPYSDYSKGDLIAYHEGGQAMVQSAFEETLKANPGMAQSLQLQLGPEPLSIRGRVVDAAGEPLKDVTVTLIDGVLNGSAVQWVESTIAGQSRRGERTDASGSFELRGLSDRTYTVRAIDSRNHLVLDSGPIQAGTKDLVLRPTKDGNRRLQGVVVDSRNHPIPDVTVELSTPWLQTKNLRSWQDIGCKVKTDADGRFVFESCPRKFVFASLAGAGIEGKSVAVLDDDQPMRISLLRRIKFRLRVTSSRGAERFRVVDSQGKRLITTSHNVNMEMHDYVHPIVTENSPSYEVDERAAELILLKDKAEVGRIPLNLRADQLNTIDI